MRNYAPMYSGAAQLGKSFAVSQGAEDEAYKKTLAELMRNEAQAAHADLYGAQAERERYRLDRQKNGRNDFLRAQTGLDDSQLGDLARAAIHGWSQTETAGPPMADGTMPTMDATPAWLTPQVRDKYNQARTTLALNDVATGDTNASQLANAMMEALKTNQAGNVIAGKQTPNSLAAAMAAVNGKPMVDVTSSGIAYDPYGSINNLNTEAFLQKAQIDATGKVNAAGVKADGPTTAAKKRQELINIGVPEQVATGVAYGTIKSVRDPVTMANVLVDVRTGQPIGRLVPTDPSNIMSPMVWESNVPGQTSEPRPTTTLEQAMKQATEELKKEGGFFSSPSRNEITKRAREIVEGSKQSPSTNQPAKSGAPKTNKPRNMPPDAEQAPDGKWYVQRNGQFYRVDE